MLREVSDYVFTIVSNVFENYVRNFKHDAAFVGLA